MPPGDRAWTTYPDIGRTAELVAPRIASYGIHLVDTTLRRRKAIAGFAVAIGMDHILSDFVLGQCRFPDQLPGARVGRLLAGPHALHNTYTDVGVRARRAIERYREQIDLLRLTRHAYIIFGRHTNVKLAPVNYNLRRARNDLIG